MKFERNNNIEQMILKNIHSRDVKKEDRSYCKSLIDNKLYVISEKNISPFNELQEIFILKLLDEFIIVMFDYSQEEVIEVIMYDPIPYFSLTEDPKKIKEEDIYIRDYMFCSDNFREM